MIGRCARAWTVLAACAYGAMCGCAGDDKRVGDTARDGADTDDDGGAATTASGAGRPGSAANATASGTARAASIPGAVRVDVRWPDAAPSARAPSGQGPCGKERRAPVSVHTLGGVASAVVRLLPTAPATRQMPAPSAEPAAHELGVTGLGVTELEVTDCRPEPRVIVTAAPGMIIRVCSRDEARRELVFQPPDTAQAPAAAPVTVSLPVTGACADVSLSGEGPWRVHADVDPEQPAYVFVAAAGGERLALTDERGAAEFTGVAPGEYQVRVWYPPAAPALPRAIEREARVIVTAGARAQTTFQLGAN